MQPEDGNWLQKIEGDTPRAIQNGDKFVRHVQ